MQNAPTAKAVLGLQHEVDFGHYGRFLGRVVGQYNSGFWSDFTHTGTFQSAYWKADLTLTYTPEVGNWSVQGFVNNVTNRATFMGTGQNAAPLPGSGVLAPPRTFGVRLSASWY
jgi:iron complex outermembrane receptor protein